MQITARNIALDDLILQLQDQQARKIDLVVPATDLTAEGGAIRLTGQKEILRTTGVTDPNSLYRPLETFLIHLSGKYKIPLDYLRRMHEQRPDIFDGNLNGWIHGGGEAAFGDRPEQFPADRRNFLFRGFMPDDGTDPVARGLLGDTFRIVDNLDTVAATLEGLRQAGVTAVGSADIGDKRMYLRLIAPAVKVWATELLKGYRSPFDDDGETRAGLGAGVERAARAIQDRGGDPVLSAGIVVANSELGFSSTSVTPRCEFLICTNGQSVTADVVRAIHHGGKQDAGAVDWSDDTRRKELALMTAKVRDAVSAYMSADYWERKVAEWTAKAGKPVDDAEATIGHVSTSLGFTEDEQKTIFRHFLLGGQRTAGGVMAAITSTAQTLESPDRAAEFEGVAVQALDLV